jgi:hypothetical protein
VGQVAFPAGFGVTEQGLRGKLHGIEKIGGSLTGLVVGGVKYSIIHNFSPPTGPIACAPLLHATFASPSTPPPRPPHATFCIVCSTHPLRVAHPRCLPCPVAPVYRGSRGKRLPRQGLPGPATPFWVKDRNSEPERGSEWELITILLRNLAYEPKIIRTPPQTSLAKST